MNRRELAALVLGASIVCLMAAATLVQNSELATMPAGTIKGRASGGGTGSPQDLSASQAKTLLEITAAVDTSGMTSGELVVATDPNTAASYPGLKRDPNTAAITITAQHTTSAGTLSVLAQPTPSLGASLYLEGRDPNNVAVPWSVVSSQTGPLILRRGAGKGANDNSDDQLQLDPNGTLFLRQTSNVPTPTSGRTSLYASGSNLYYNSGSGAVQVGGNGTLTVTSPSATQEAQIKTKLLLHFDGTNGGTTFTDENGATITAVGNSQLSTTSPKYGTAAGLFDGTGDYLSVPFSSVYEFGDNDFTIEMWTKGTGTNSYACLINHPSSSGFASSAWSLFYNPGSANGRLQFWVANYSTVAAMLAASSGDVHDGSWHHVAVTRNGPAWTLWLDGSSVATATSATVITGGVRGIYIATDANYASRDHNGRIDDLRIVVGKAVYTAAFTPPTGAHDAPIITKTMYWDAVNSAIYAY